MKEAPLAPPKPPPLPTRPLPREAVGTPAAPKSGWPLWVYVVAAGGGALLVAMPLVGVAMIFLPARQDEPDTVATPAPLPGEAEVYRQACRLVSDYLIAPKTAEFGDVSELVSLNAETPSWRVAGTFDAQNRFGVFLRGKFSCEINFDPTSSRWLLAYAIVDDKLVYASDEVKQLLTSIDDKQQKAAEAGPWKHIETVLGNGAMRTSPFYVQRPPLRVKWQNSSRGALTVWVRAATGSGDERHLVATAVEAGVGEKVLHIPAGSYFVDADATGAWNVTLEEK